MQTWDGYTRVSRVAGREGASFISPAVQRATIERLAKAKGVELGEVVEELDVSGAKPIDERELGRLIQKIEAGQSGGVLVWRVSRFSRNLLDAVTVAERIRDAGGALVGDDLDTTAPMGRAMLGFLAGWAEEERDQRRAAWRAATDSATKRGLHLGRVPLGYVRTTIHGRNGPLAIDHDHPERVDAVRYAFAARGQGDSWRSIQKAVREQYGIHLSVSTVQQMVATRVYTGQVQRGDQIVNGRAHPALVDEADWQRAQHARGARPTRNGRLASQGILAGLVYCAGCGGVVSTNSTGDSRKAAYGCQNKRKAECPAPASVSVHLLDAYVLPGILERMGAAFDVQAYVNNRERARLAIIAAEDEMDAFLAHASAAALGERYTTEAERRREAIREAVAAWEEFEAFRHPAGALGHDPGTWDTTPIEFQRDAARAVIQRVTISRAGKGSGRWVPLADRVGVVWRALELPRVP
jgi:DNA invertase Pin-like site-specific DNA recombinase